MTRAYCLGALLLALAGVLAGCGGGSACGNKQLDPGEECDDGNSRDDDGCSNACLSQEVADVALQWRILHEIVPGFDENCDGVRAATAKIHLEGPMPGDFEVECNFSQYVVSAVRTGDYTATVTLFDELGMPVTKPASTAFTVAATNLVVAVDIKLTDLLSTTGLTGDWFYRFKWNGSTTCAGAHPPVVGTRIRLDRSGSALIDDTGHAIDGMTVTPCYDFAAEFAHAVNGLPFGPAKLYITGVDAQGQGRFVGTFDTFIGSGIVNPPLEFDVLGGDPDAGPPDASVPDAT